MEVSFSIVWSENPIGKLNLSFRNLIEFKLLVKKIREIEIVLGNKNKNIQKSEKENYKYLRRSAAAITDLSAKTRIKKSHITGIRPLTGIPIEEINRIIGKKLRKKLKKGQIIKKSNLE